MQISHCDSGIIIPRWAHPKTGLRTWIPTQGLIVEKEKRLIEPACACGHKRTRQEFRERMWILREMIWRPLLPFSQQWWRQSMCCVLPGLSCSLPLASSLCVKSQAPALDSKLQEAKQSNTAQFKENLKEKTEYFQLVAVAVSPVLPGKWCKQIDLNCDMEPVCCITEKLPCSVQWVWLCGYVARGL